MTPATPVRREAGYVVATQGDTFALAPVKEALNRAESDAALNGGRVSVHVDQRRNRDRMDTMIKFLVRG